MCGQHGKKFKYIGGCVNSFYSTKKCNCYRGWDGDYCTKPTCIGYQDFCYGRGKCVIKNGMHTCQCNPGWSGARCKNITCDRINKCGQHGNIKYLFRILLYIRNPT